MYKLKLALLALLAASLSGFGQTPLQWWIDHLAPSPDGRYPAWGEGQFE